MPDASIVDDTVRPPEAVTPPATLQEAPVAEVVRRFRPDGRGPVTQQIYRLLHKLIVNLRLMPNQLLIESDVAASFGVSKTPVREALIRLAEERLVSIVPHKGAFVSPIDIRRVFEGYFIRMSLESSCAERLALSAREEDVRALADIVADQKRALDDGDCDAFYVLDNVFHSASFDRAGLAHTRRRVEIAKAEVDRVKSLKSVYRFCRPERELYDEHVLILDAIAGGDGPRAKSEIRRHLTGMNDAIQDIAKDERLWRFVNRVNQVAVHSRLPAKERERVPPENLSLPNHPHNS